MCLSCMSRMNKRQWCPVMQSPGTRSATAHSITFQTLHCPTNPTGHLSMDDTKAEKPTDVHKHEILIPPTLDVLSIPGGSSTYEQHGESGTQYHRGIQPSKNQEDAVKPLTVGQTHRTAVHQVSTS